MASSEADSMAESTDTATSTAALDAKARREARKARILSSGNNRLARITKTGRGGEADVLYSDPPARAGSQQPSSSSGGHAASDNPAGLLRDDEELMQSRARAAMLGGGVPNSEDDPGEVDISQSAQALGGGQVGNDFMAGQMGGQEGMPQDLQGMMRMMQSTMLGGGGAGGGLPGQGQAGGADSGAQSPFGFPFAPSGPDSAQQQQQKAQQSSTSSLLDSLFNLLRIGVFVGFGIVLVYGALSGHAPAERSVSEDESVVGDKFEHMTSLHRWARLAYERPAHWEARYFGVESFGLPIHGIPVFWLFITLEIALQSSRIMLQRSRPSPPGFLLKASAYVPNAHIRLLIRTLASYLPLLDAFVNDLAIVIFTIGCTIMFASWKVGLDPILASSDATLGLNVGLQSGASSVGEKLMEMNSPVMAGNAPIQAAL